MSFKEILNDHSKCVADGISLCQETCHGLAREAGWWDNRDLDDPQTIPTCLCLVHSEVSEAIEAARKRYSRSGGAPLDNRWPELEPGLYLIPADEFVPMTRMVAKLFNTRFYVGNACKYHPLNHIRMTSTRQCTVCRILEQKGCKSLY